MDLIRKHISFSSLLAIAIMNFSLFATLISVFMNTVLTPKIIVISILTIFCFNTLFIGFLLYWILRREVFHSYVLKNNILGDTVLKTISSELHISIQNIEGNIFHSTYYYKRKWSRDIIHKEILFIIEGNRIFLNIRNKNDAIFLYQEDSTEKRIKEILLKNALLTINHVPYK